MSNLVRSLDGDVCVQVGDCWYAKLPGQKKITEVKVLEFTKYTMLLEISNELAQFGIISSEKVRYQTLDPIFVERI